MTDIIITINAEDNIPTRAYLESSIINDITPDSKKNQKFYKVKDFHEEESHHFLNVKTPGNSRRPSYLTSEGDADNVPSSTLKLDVDEHSKESYAKWKNITRVAQCVAKFHSIRVEHIKSEDKLKMTLTTLPSPMIRSKSQEGPMYITHHDMHRDALHAFRDQSHFFAVLESAGKEDFANIRNALKHDPMNNMYEEESCNRMVNKPDYRGYTPLYVACKNGNIDLVKLLLEFKANPYQNCAVSAGFEESIIAVAARWTHLEIVKYLTSDIFEWPMNELRKAYEEAGNGEIKKLINEKLGHFKQSFLRCCFGCFMKN